MKYHYPHQQHPHQPFPTTFPSSTPYTLPPALLQALHRLATFSSDIQLLTSHFAPHLHFNSYPTPFSKPVPRSLARRRKPTPRSTAWRLQQATPYEADPSTNVLISKDPLSSLFPTWISTLPLRPASAPPLDLNRPVSKVPRTSSTPPCITRSRVRAKPHELAQIGQPSDSADLIMLPRTSIKHRTVAATSPVTNLIQIQPLISNHPVHNSRHQPADQAVLASQPDTVPASGPTINTLELAATPVVLSDPAVSAVHPTNDGKSNLAIDLLQNVSTQHISSVIDVDPIHNTPVNLTSVKAINLLPAPTVNSVPTVHKVLESQSTSSENSRSVVSFDLTNITVDLAPSSAINPISDRLHACLGDSTNVGSDSDIDWVPNDFAHKAPVASKPPSTAIDQILDTPDSHINAYIQDDLDPVTEISTIDPIFGIDLRETPTISDVDQVPKVSAVDLVPIPPTTSSQLTNSILSSNNVTSSAVKKNNKKKKKKKKKSKTSTLTTPSPHLLHHEVGSTSNFVLSSEEGWIEFDSVSGNYHDNKWHPRPQQTHYEQLIMVNHLLDQHPDYLLLRVNRQGILLGKDRDKDPHEQDVICYSSSGEFSFRRDKGKVFHHPSDSFY
ncbi:hypothetical protein DFH28DRAFT_907131 [Melampsora americana]|nr:hypothetical protein DFH28DRAFT_907131 [Melampsora americana]